MTIFVVATFLLSTGAVAEETQTKQSIGPGLSDPCMPLDGTWVKLDELMSPGSFFAETFTWNSTNPVKFTITDFAAATDVFEVYDNGILVVTTPSLPSWDALGLSDPFVSPPWTLDPDIALADGRFSSAVIDFASGSHAITIRDISIPNNLLRNGPFPDGTVAFKAVPEPATLLLLGLGAVMLRRKR